MPEMLPSTPQRVPTRPLPLRVKTPRATLVAKPRLRVLEEPAPSPSAFARQDCSSCPNVIHCWATPSTEHGDRLIVTNILVCRIKNASPSARDQATKLFLAMCQQPIQRLASKIIQKSPKESREDVVRDLEERTITRLLHSYRIGEIGFPLHFLFGPGGAIVWDAVNYTRRRSVSLPTVSLDDDTDYFDRAGRPLQLASDAPDPEESTDAARVDAKLARALAVVDDGFTLSAREHRVFRYVLTHGDGAIATALAKVGRRMNLGREELTTVYRTAARKVVSATLRLGARAAVPEVADDDADEDEDDDL